MQDPPATDQILAQVIAFLRDRIAPQLDGNLAFQLRIAANALDLVARAHRSGGEDAARERADLQRLLGIDGETAELTAVLCDRIEAGEIGIGTPGLIDHLRRTTLAKLAIDQPTYASYRQALIDWAHLSA
jgi:hypothetical protein